MVKGEEVVMGGGLVKVEVVKVGVVKVGVVKGERVVQAMHRLGRKGGDGSRGW